MNVHVRLNQGMAVSEAGELVEQFGCRCGESWTRTYQVEDPEAD